ncbi:MAG: hypothetical protein K2K52_06840 [Paramuribaculum sp.]|nr:hypothetical protein [Paramuribaculum sp.]
MYKKALILIIYSLSVNFISAQFKKVRVEPAYVATKLLDMVESKDYPEVCIYYGYQPDSTATEGTHIYTDSKGSSVYWIDSQTEDSDSIHELKFRTNQSISAIESALTQCGYKKTTTPKVDIPSVSGTRFEKRNKYSDRSRVIIIQSGSPNTLHLIRKR